MLKKLKFKLKCLWYPYLRRVKRIKRLIHKHQEAVTEIKKAIIRNDISLLLNDFENNPAKFRIWELNDITRHLRITCESILESVEDINNTISWNPCTIETYNINSLEDYKRARLIDLLKNKINIFGIDLPPIHWATVEFLIYRRSEKYSFMWGALANFNPNNDSFNITKKLTNYQIRVLSKVGIRTAETINDAA